MDKSWRVILAFIGIFVAGTVTGGLITLRVVQKIGERRAVAAWRIFEGRQNPPPGNPAQGNPANSAPPPVGPQFFRRVIGQLDLTPEQKEKFKPIETHAMEDYRRLLRDTQHSTDLISEKTQDEIAVILTPEQRAKFEDLVAKARERRKKWVQDQDFTNRLRREQANPNRQREALPPKDRDK